MSAILIAVAARIAAALKIANGNSEHETAMRLLKVSEEAGEASADLTAKLDAVARRLGTTGLPCTSTAGQTEAQ
ncbi:hypothetical protein [Streptomyces mangrovisoli]|uniref:Uncharacterized protein n=1 Tax=Streptomyces mangrovisoli TaxID=1428628 RepID=A0A1J4P6V4_9ACTN|nr:hypothetical protein [Streptomyces mangrovisoli]OIJ69221.1 hypothetical protein WN71_003960 [Streptomyces mangrovisoli]